MSQEELIWVAFTKVGIGRSEELLIALGKLSNHQTIKDLEARINLLLGQKVKLEGKLKAQTANSQFALKKLNESTKVIRKIGTYIGHPSDVVNKTKLFNNNLANHLVSGANVILILVGFVQKMEELFDDMRSLLDSLDVVPTTATTPLENIPDISLEMELILGSPKLTSHRDHANKTRSLGSIWVGPSDPEVPHQKRER